MSRSLVDSVARRSSRDDTQQRLLDECAARSRALLRANLTPRGILAASSSERAAERGYIRIFGRDAAICALAMARSWAATIILAGWRRLLWPVLSDARRRSRRALLSTGGRDVGV